MSEKRERLEYAINRLEYLYKRSDSRYGLHLAPDDDGVLALVADPRDMNLGTFSFHRESWMHNDPKWPDREVLAMAELMVTLHRTIDAQIAILRNAAGDPESPDEPASLEDALALADAIFGAEF